MSLPSTQELESVVVDILARARDDGRLSQLTVRIVRQELAIHFNIEEGVLNSGVYKSFIKDAVHATVDRLQNATDEGTEPSQREAPKKEKLDGTAKTGSRRRKSKVQVHSDEEPPEEASVSAGNAPSPKKASALPKLSKPAKPSKTSKKPENEMKYKSKAIIESSDEEGVAESGIQKSTRSPKEKMSAKPSPPKQKQQQQKVNKNHSDVEMDNGEGPGPASSSSSSKPKRGTESSKSSKAKQLNKDPMESELSSVIDEPPKKRQKRQDIESVKPQKDEKAKRGKKEVLSKDEETVNKLKGIIVACGIRKVWKKEFEGLERPSQQIKRLHSILGDLGMMPRYSLEKAKAIRERRELAQELQDVQEFEKANKRRGKGPRKPSETEESADEDDNDADVPERKKKNPRASIMAFLQDQSEEE